MAGYRDKWVTADENIPTALIPRVLPDFSTLWKVRFRPGACYVLAGSPEERSSWRAIFIFKEQTEMSKKNRNPWKHQNAAPKPSAPAQPNEPTAREAITATDFSSLPGVISPAQLAANRANSLKSTGPRTDAGKASSSKNAVKSALTGRTVLLPTDDRDEYARFLADLQHDLKPIGQLECELVQIIVDCHWRLRRIQELEYALYAHGEEQFADVFADCHPDDRRSKIVLETHLTYEKQLRNLHVQEARIDRKRVQALAELKALQADRTAPNQQTTDEPFDSDREFFAALDAGYVPPYIADGFHKLTREQQNGFVFSNQENETVEDASATVTESNSEVAIAA
jgi:hypothetical protein